eukprot:849133-Rhodomonas_salina.3
MQVALANSGARVSVRGANGIREQQMLTQYLWSYTVARSTLHYTWWKAVVTAVRLKVQEMGRCRGWCCRTSHPPSYGE